jgi:hypothetical protein
MATGTAQNQPRPSSSTVGIIALKLVIATLLLVGGALLLTL